MEIPLVCWNSWRNNANVHPMAKICYKDPRCFKSAQELSCVIASATGLAQNFSAMRALATDGIQKGHMKLHAKESR